MQAWIAEEFADLELGDERRNARLRRLLEQRMNHPNLSIPASIEASPTASHKAEVEAAYRFFANDAVDEQAILEPLYARTRERIGQESVAIVAQDTTLLNLTRPHFVMTGIGPLGGTNDPRVGLLDHTLLAMTVDRVPLGLLPGTIWTRDADDPQRELSRKERTKLRRQTPFEEKESVRWLDGYQVCCAVAAQAPSTQLICVSDSESDIFELLAETKRSEAGPRASFILRACQNRHLDGAKKLESARLFDAARNLRKLGKYVLELRPRDAQSDDGSKRRMARSAREAECEVRAGTLTIAPPQDLGSTAAPVTVNVVYVRERHPPAGEPALEWLLLTDLPVASFKAALLVVTYYGCRWQIEIYFKVLKSGCRIEASQLETVERFHNFLALTKVIAWRVLRLTMLGRAQPDLPCTAMLDPDEWQAAYAFVRQLPPPLAPPTLSEMIKIVAQLGGFMGRKCDGMPGPKTMWIGMQRMRDLAIGWQTRELYPFAKTRRQRRPANCVE